mmetsp:Transcript_16217/g.49561  ORF Transcript_16217/g.49561 Transcript_16217/m.49561 type:complete len:234 (-) Transcript_16217:1827-2528(-)
MVRRGLRPAATGWSRRQGPAELADLRGPRRLPEGPQLPRPGDPGDAERRAVPARPHLELAQVAKVVAGALEPAHLQHARRAGDAAGARERARARAGARRLSVQRRRSREHDALGLRVRQRPGGLVQLLPEHVHPRPRRPSRARAAVDGGEPSDGGGAAPGGCLLAARRSPSACVPVAGVLALHFAPARRTQRRRLAAARSRRPSEDRYHRGAHPRARRGPLPRLHAAASRRLP